MIFVVQEDAGANEVDFDERPKETRNEGDDDSGARRIAEMGAGDEGRDKQCHTRGQVERCDGNDVRQNEKAYRHLGFPIGDDGFFINDGPSDSSDVGTGEQGNGPPGGFCKIRMCVARGAEMGVQSIEQYAEGCANAREKEHGATEAGKVELHVAS